MGDLRRQFPLGAGIITNAHYAEQHPRSPQVRHGKVVGYCSDGSTLWIKWDDRKSKNPLSVNFVSRDDQQTDEHAEASEGNS